MRWDCFINDSWKALQGCVNRLMTLFEWLKSEGSEKSEVFSSGKDTLICVAASIKLDTKTKGGIVCMSMREDAAD